VDLLNDANLMTQYSREIIIRVLSQAAQTGASFDEIVAALIKHPEFGPMRARRIARTETVTSANGAAMIYAQESGNQLNKYWIAVKDSRTRHDHKMVDGKVVNYDAPFVINSPQFGLVEMMQPGVRTQSNGLEVPAGEVVNCRCVVAFKAKRDANGNIIRR
jgi:SPP1 gp7 family putative phage head morphogenesis protein